MPYAAKGESNDLVMASRRARDEARALLDEDIRAKTLDLEVHWGPHTTDRDMLDAIERRSSAYENAVSVGKEPDLRAARGGEESGRQGA